MNKVPKHLIETALDRKEELNSRLPTMEDALRGLPMTSSSPIYQICLDILLSELSWPSTLCDEPVTGILIRKGGVCLPLLNGDLINGEC